MLRSPPRQAGAAILAGLAIALAIPGTGAVSQVSPPGPVSPPSPVLQVQPLATLRANGAAVALTVKVNCSGGSPTGLNVNVTQAQGQGTTGGGGFAGVVCTGGEQTVVTFPQVFPPNPPFARGTAFASAGMYVCGPGFCQETADRREISIR